MPLTALATALAVLVALSAIGGGVGLRNAGSAAATLGEPRAEVRTGCFPGPLALGHRSLAPGQSTTLTFELSMHAGMEGPHDLAVHVPVAAEGSPASHLLLGSSATSADHRRELLTYVP